MRLLWDLYWPVLVAALVIGVISGALAYRRRETRSGMLRWIGFGAAATIAAAALWHGPFEAAEKYRNFIETSARTTLVHYEMTQVQARLSSTPLNRTLVLSGAADDFQRSELVRIFEAAPGVAAVQWRDSGEGSSFPLPLLLEVVLWSLAAFCLGLLLAYLVELRRRARADWRW